MLGVSERLSYVRAMDTAADILAVIVPALLVLELDTVTANLSPITVAASAVRLAVLPGLVIVAPEPDGFTGQLLTGDFAMSKVRYIVTLEGNGSADDQDSIRSLRAWLKRFGRNLLLKCTDIKVETVES